MPPAQKKKAAYTPPKDLNALLDASVKKYGDSVVRHDQAKKILFIPTGVTGLDVALGGGIPVGRVSEFVGKPGSGKTSTLVSALARAQEMFPDRAVAYIDIERTWTDEWAEALGVDRKRCLYAKPKYSEQAVDIARDWMRSGMVSMVVIDSIGGMERQETMYEKSAEDNDMGKNSQVITRMAKQLATIGNDNDVATVFVNQFRADLKNPGFDKASGPMILGYSTTCSVSMRGTGGADNTITVKRGGQDVVVSYKIIAKVTRSKLIASGRQAEFWFNKESGEWGSVGIDEIPELVGLAQMQGIITPDKGSWWVLPDGTRVNGQAKVVLAVREDLSLQEKIRTMLIENVADDLIEQPETEFVPA